MKLLIKKVHLKEIPTVTNEKQRNLVMSVAILEDIVKKTVSKTEKTEKYSAKLTPDAPPFFTCANVTKNEDIFELMKAV